LDNRPNNPEYYRSKANLFFEYFLSMLEESEKVNLENYSSSELWTEIITSSRESIIDLVFKKYSNSDDPKTNHEYFRVDNILYSRPDELELESELYNVKDDTKLNRHIWDLIIAVEHENDRNDWTDEITKLMHIRSELRVVISYSSTIDQKKEIIAATELIKHFGNYVRPEEGAFMLILGCRTDQLDSNEEIDIKEKIIKGYKAYIWNGIELVDYKENQ